MKNRTRLLLPLILGLSLPACAVNLNNRVVDSSTIGEKIAVNTLFVGEPKFESFPEIAYYSYSMSEESDPSSSFEDSLESSDSQEEMESESTSTESTSVPPMFSSIKRPETSKEPEESEDKELKPYEDENGRIHYPIAKQESYIFKNFTYFSFFSENCDFLEERIGNGEVDGLIVETEIFSETMLVLKNDNRYYSCLLNGAHYGGSNGGYYQFSAHKYIEGFEIIKDSNKYFLTVELSAFPDSLTTITIGKDTFDIKPEYTIYDEGSIEVPVNELRKRFGLEGDPAFE